VNIVHNTAECEYNH